MAAKRHRHTNDPSKIVLSAANNENDVAEEHAEDPDKCVVGGVQVEEVLHDVWLEHGEKLIALPAQDA